ncbi:hypothetical protein CB1_000467003 [Camelus ferus]|nr:hypothetical protein CB1_000467003 [Camelus ferus]
MYWPPSPTHFPDPSCVCWDHPSKPLTLRVEASLSRCLSTTRAGAAGPDSTRRAAGSRGQSSGEMAAPVKQSPGGPQVLQLCGVPGSCRLRGAGPSQQSPQSKENSLASGSLQLGGAGVTSMQPSPLPAPEPDVCAPAYFRSCKLTGDAGVGAEDQRVNASTHVSWARWPFVVTRGGGSKASAGRLPDLILTTRGLPWTAYHAVGGGSQEEQAPGPAGPPGPGAPVVVARCQREGEEEEETSAEVAGRMQDVGPTGGDAV